MEDRDRLARIEAAITRVEQALKGYNGHGGLIRDVERAHQRIDNVKGRVESLERSRWTAEGIRGILAATVSFLTALLTGRQG